MHGHTTPRRRRAIHCALVGIALGAAGLISTDAFAQMVLRNATVSNGAPSSVSAGGYTLSATIGEAIANVSVGAGGMVIHSGFQATSTSITHTNDQLFADGFED